MSVRVYQNGPPGISALITALYAHGRVKEAAIQCAQASLFCRTQDLLYDLTLPHPTLSKLKVIGAKCLTCWPPWLIAALNDQIVLLHECTAHHLSVLEEAVQNNELPGRKQLNAVIYLMQRGNRDRADRRACREEALAELRRRRFAAS